MATKSPTIPITKTIRKRLDAALVFDFAYVHGVCLRRKRVTELQLLLPILVASNATEKTAPDPGPASARPGLRWEQPEAPVVWYVWTVC